MNNNPQYGINPMQFTNPMGAPNPQGLLPISQGIMPMPQCMYMPVMPVMPDLAHAYVPFQYLNCVYPPMKGLERYTIFPELDRPYGTEPEYTVDE